MSRYSFLSALLSIQSPTNTSIPPRQASVEITGHFVSQGDHDEKTDMIVELILTEIPYAVLLATAITFAIRFRPK
jgi:hypothetical protein